MIEHTSKLGTQMDEMQRQLAIYRDKYLASNQRIERLEAQLGEALEELTATRSVFRDLRRESDRLTKRLSVAHERASWYRAKLLAFVTTKWIAQEKRKDGI